MIAEVLVEEKTLSTEDYLKFSEPAKDFLKKLKYVQQVSNNWGGFNRNYSLKS